MRFCARTDGAMPLCTITPGPANQTPRLPSGLFTPCQGFGHGQLTRHADLHRRPLHRLLGRDEGVEGPRLDLAWVRPRRRPRRAAWEHLGSCGSGLGLVRTSWA